MNGVGGGRFADAAALADAIAATWAGGEANRYVVFTGGEPLLQLDETLIAAVHDRGFEVAVETNGTLPAPPGIDWICVSPKAGNPLAQTSGHELKLVFPQAEAPPERFAELPFRHRFLQPMDGAGGGGQHRRGGGLLPVGRPLAAVAADPQDHRDPVRVRSTGFSHPTPSLEAAFAAPHPEGVDRTITASVGAVCTLSRRTGPSLTG